MPLPLLLRAPWLELPLLLLPLPLPELPLLLPLLSLPLPELPLLLSLLPLLLLRSPEPELSGVPPLPDIYEANASLTLRRTRWLPRIMWSPSREFALLPAALGGGGIRTVSRSAT